MFLFDFMQKKWKQTANEEKSYKISTIRNNVFFPQVSKLTHISGLRKTFTFIPCSQDFVHSGKYKKIYTN